VKIERRLRALESKMLADPVILHFADGSTRQISGGGGFLLRLFYDACAGADLTPVRAEQLDLIRQSVAAQEPGGARMTEIFLCFLRGRRTRQRQGFPA
jgi:hypothetical protein